uniref:Uncharacterized protein n=1 Tax=Rhizophora mucronata TaxID=61149 RepID=A0A2P2Q396_RHIMU
MLSTHTYVNNRKQLHRHRSDGQLDITITKMILLFFSLFCQSLLHLANVSLHISTKVNCTFHAQHSHCMCMRTRHPTPHRLVYHGNFRITTV